MAGRLGENIQHEWDEEPHAGELWDALQALKRDTDAGIAALSDLARGGSALAMMYLGHAYVSRGGESRSVPGETWLIRSAESGSIEGRFQLARYYQRQKDWERALAELETLAGQGYSPAMYVLGLSLYRGDWGVRSVAEAIEYLKMANDTGHLPAMALLSWIYRREHYGLVGRLKAHWHCLAKTPALAWYLWRYPGSDRLRGGPGSPTAI